MMGDHIEFPTLHWLLWLFTGSTWLIQGCVYALSKVFIDIMSRIVGRHWYEPGAGYLLGLSFLSLRHQPLDMHSQLHINALELNLNMTQN